MQLHVLSFEGPDGYARAGGIASRIEGLTESFEALGHETHLWFVGDPGLPGLERRGQLHLHRWCQWISRFHPGGVYDGEQGKQLDYSSSLPPHLIADALLPHLRSGGTATVLAEEWHTADAVLHLDWLLRSEGMRDRVNLLWNANNVFGFERIDWVRLQKAAMITTVSRWMKHVMAPLGVDALVVPNGLPAHAYLPADASAVGRLRSRLRDRVVLTKMARFDPDKRWLGAVEIVREMKQRGLRPLLVARGGSEAHGHDVMRAAHAAGLRVADRNGAATGIEGLVDRLDSVGDVDVVNLQVPVDPDSRRVLFQASNAVLANSEREPFGLVGLETMAAGGLACTGISGEDYAVPGRNALVLQTDDPREFVGLWQRLRTNPAEERALRRSGRTTANHYAWPEVIRRNFLPRLELLQEA
jgi:glycosyltransferase involved in cell wall biosynthesis